MATSGTTSFAPTLDDIVEEAFERAGREPRSGYDFRTARRSLNLLLADWANRGVNLWTVDSDEEVLVAGQAEYVLPSDTIDVIEMVLRTTSGAETFDRYVTRMHVNTYARLATKEQQGLPLKALVTRGVEHPTLTLWPVPDAAMTYTLVYWRLRRMQDAGNGSTTQDIPFRLVPALIAGLAHSIAQKIPEGRERLQYLKQEYDETWDRAAGEDRDRSSVFIRPSITL